MTGAGSLVSDTREGPHHSGAGVVIWITGLSGAGKSVLARRVYDLLKRHRPNVVLLDGDEFRRLWADGIGHTAEERRVVARRLSRFCRFLGDQGIHVVCATISLFHEIHEWNRRNLRSYFEVYLRVPIEVLVERDAGNLYSRARAGSLRNVVGVDLPFDEPGRPDLILDNAEERADFTEWAWRILRASGCVNGHGGGLP